MPTGTSVTTAGGGRATLDNGEQRIVVAPNSRLTVQPDAGGFKRIAQDLGAAMFKVDKKAAPHFRVDTPLLAAIVKGTTFTVMVEGASDAVSVAEGLVEVRSNLNATVGSDVAAGATGTVMRDSPSAVQVVTPAAAPAGPALAPVNIAPIDYKAASDGLIDIAPAVAQAGQDLVAVRAVAAAAPSNDNVGAAVQDGPSVTTGGATPASGSVGVAVSQIASLEAGQRENATQVATAPSAMTENGRPSSASNNGNGASGNGNAAVASQNAGNGNSNAGPGGLGPAAGGTDSGSGRGNGNGLGGAGGLADAAGGGKDRESKDDKGNGNGMGGAGGLADAAGGGKDKGPKDDKGNGNALGGLGGLADAAGGGKDKGPKDDKGNGNGLGGLGGLADAAGGGKDKEPKDEKGNGNGLGGLGGLADAAGGGKDKEPKGDKGNSGADGLIGGLLTTVADAGNGNGNSGNGNAGSGNSGNGNSGPGSDNSGDDKGRGRGRD